MAKKPRHDLHDLEAEIVRLQAALKFWKVKGAHHARGEAQARAQLAALVAQTTATQQQAAGVAFNTLLTELGLDPKAVYALDDVAETITFASQKAPGIK